MKITTKTFTPFVCAMAIFSGCQTPPPPALVTSQPYTPATTTGGSSMTQERNALRNDLAERKKALSQAKLRDEIDRLNKEIADLQSKIDELEARIAKAERESATQKATATPSGTNVGPRGGCYTITKSGKKNYGAC